jgi:hypothetical protein
MSFISQRQLEQCRKIEIKGWGEGQLPVIGYFDGVQDLRMHVVREYALLEKGEVREKVIPGCVDVFKGATERDVAEILFELVARRRDVPAREVFEGVTRDRSNLHLENAVLDIGGRLMVDILTRK